VCFVLIFWHTFGTLGDEKGQHIARPDNKVKVFNPLIV